eukprot:TRINITY_DN12453_c0_g2_i1.p1 TRINITY_DN12453_c0_g2~~TRINITY_DN12453_c0_g2_i1.p1  ORF type:complete len:1639 (-),score=257.57 TRINITY_DN12453_c0_g2_i1:222-4985(-)
MLRSLVGSEMCIRDRSRIAKGEGIVAEAGAEKQRPKSKLGSALSKLRVQLAPDQYLATVSTLMHYLQQTRGHHEFDHHRRPHPGDLDDGDSSDGGLAPGTGLLPGFLQEHEDMEHGSSSIPPDLRQLRRQCEALGFNIPFHLEEEEEEEEVHEMAEEEEDDELDEDQNENQHLDPIPEEIFNQPAEPPPPHADNKRKHRNEHRPTPMMLKKRNIAQPSPKQLRSEKKNKTVSCVSALDPVYNRNIGMHGEAGKACMEAIGFRFDKSTNSFACSEPCTPRACCDLKAVLVTASGLPAGALSKDPEKVLHALSGMIDLAKRTDQAYGELCRAHGIAVDEHPIRVTLCTISTELRAAADPKSTCSSQANTFTKLKELLLAPDGLTSYEIQTSQLANAFAEYLRCGDPDSDSQGSAAARMKRLAVVADVLGDDTKAGNNLATLFQDQLSQIETLEVITYDAVAGLGQGLNALRSPLQIKFVRCEGEESLKDCTPDRILVEPTATGQDIQAWLQKRVEKKWHEADRPSLEFLKIASSGITIAAQGEAPSNGLMHWIGTNALTQAWTNPARHGLIAVETSSGSSANLLEASGCDLGTSEHDVIIMDMGMLIKVNAYACKFKGSLDSLAAAELLVLGSHTGNQHDWYVLAAHEGNSVPAPWPISGHARKHTAGRGKKRSSGPSKQEESRSKKTRSNDLGNIASRLRATKSHPNNSTEPDSIGTRSSSRKSQTKEPKLPPAPPAAPEPTRTTRSSSQRICLSGAASEDGDPSPRGTRAGARTSTSKSPACELRDKRQTKLRRLDKTKSKPEPELTQNPEPVLTQAPSSFRFIKLIREKVHHKSPSVRICNFEIFGEIVEACHDKPCVPSLPSPKPASRTWEWRDEEGIWCRYDLQTSARLDQAFTQGESHVSLSTGYFSSHGGYIVDLDQKIQVNTRTGFARPIRRQKQNNNDMLSQRSHLLSMSGAEDGLPLFSSRHLHDLLGPSPVLRRDFSALAPLFDPASDPVGAHSNPTQMLSVVRAGDQEQEPGTSPSTPLFLHLAASSSHVIELGDQRTILQGIQDLCIAQSESHAMTVGSTDWAEKLWHDTHEVYFSTTPPSSVKLSNHGAARSPALFSSRSEAVCASAAPNLSIVGGTMNDIVYLLHLLWGARVVDPSFLESDCLTNKLKVQMEDVVSVCCGTVPQWCACLMQYNPLLFGKDARFNLFASRSLGFSRTVSRLQRHSGNSSVPWRQQRVGHLVTERVMVPRDEQVFFTAAEKAMKLYANRRTVLDFAFEGEEGTGVGPTAEFYTLASMGFHTNCAKWLWRDVDSERGLFPALLPHAKDDAAKVLELWTFFGRFIARALLDNRLIDMHLSSSFCELLCGRQLTMEDIENADPGLKSLMTLDADAVEAVCQTMSWEGWELVPGGCDMDVTVDNLEEFKTKAATFVLSTGIQQQIQALQSGFEEACPLHSLHALTSEELRTQLTGEGCLDWCLDDLKDAVEPKHGYTSDSPAFMMLLEVLVEMSGEERKKFIWWATGSPRLPPGGLHKLSPHKLSIVLKTEGERQPDDIMVSVNVCNKAIKLPDYSDRKVLHERLRAAINTKEAREFHLN